jgi:hypothetical protein
METVENIIETPPAVRRGKSLKFSASVAGWRSAPARRSASEFCKIRTVSRHGAQPPRLIMTARVFGRRLLPFGGESSDGTGDDDSESGRI